MQELYKELERTCERATKELGDLNNRLDSNKNLLSPADVDMMDKLTHTIKSIKKVMMVLEEHGENQNGYSGNSYYSQPMWDRDYSGNSYHGTYTVATGEPNGYGYSGRRNPRHMYSRDTERDNMMSELDNMLNNARDEREVDIIRRVMSKL